LLELDKGEEIPSVLCIQTLITTRTDLIYLTVSPSVFINNLVVYNLH